MNWNIKKNTELPSHKKAHFASVLCEFQLLQPVIATTILV